MEKLQSDDPVVNIRMGYYWGNEYVLSTETLNAVRESGKTLNITWPGVEASATYIWTFHGSEMGEVTVPVNLLVLFPLDNDETVTAIDGKMTNQPRRIVLDFQHSGPLPAGTDFATLSFSFDNIDAGQDGYYYYFSPFNAPFLSSRMGGLSVLFDSRAYRGRFRTSLIFPFNS